MPFINTILLALAVSLDGFVAGLAYGARRIQIKGGALLIMCACSMTAVLCSMLLGRGLVRLLDPRVGKTIGAGMLIILGLWVLIGTALKKADNRAEQSDAPVLLLNIRFLGLIIQILREPSRADLDCSGEIGYKEALFLGTALAVDSLYTGLGAAMANLNIAMTVAAVGLFKYMLVRCGILLGQWFQESVMQRFAPIIAGLVLCLLGILNL